MNKKDCQCKICVRRKNIIKEICKQKNLDYNKLTDIEKTDLYCYGIHTREEHKEHNWKIMAKRFNHAKIDDRDRLLDEYLELVKDNNNDIAEMKNEIEKLTNYLKEELDNIEYNDFNGKLNAIKRLENQIKEKESYGKAIELCRDIIFDKIESVEYKEGV